MVSLQPRFREEQIGIITSFIRHVLEDSGYRGLVVGMSGGVDSSLVAKLCVEAVGAGPVVGVWGGGGGPRAARLRRSPIPPLVETFRRSLKIRKDNLTTLGNIKARVRMIVLYSIANTEKRLVIGSGNKSELAAAYFRKFGDGGVDFLPIGDLYKTQVREMAAHLGVPKRVLK